MAYIKKKSERKFKITVCNGYKVNGQKRMKAQTITVPSSVPKRGIQQYVMAEAERIEKKFKYGVEESDQTHFEQYAENWLKRQEPFFKATTYAGYKRNLDIESSRFLLTPTVMCRTRILLHGICASYIKSVGYRKIITCIPCGISTQPICCRKAPVNRWRHPCWVMRIRHFWSAPTAIRRTWRNSRPQT